jgi:hypothetical protein
MVAFWAIHTLIFWENDFSNYIKNYKNIHIKTDKIWWKGRNEFLGLEVRRENCIVVRKGNSPSWVGNKNTLSCCSDDSKQVWGFCAPGLEMIILTDCTVGSGNLTNFLPQAVSETSKCCNLLKNGLICKPQIALESYWSVLQYYKRILHVWFKIVKQFGSFLYTTYHLVLPPFVEIICCILLGILEMSIWSCSRDTWSHTPCTVCLISSLFFGLLWCCNKSFTIFQRCYKTTNKWCKQMTLLDGWTSPLDVAMLMG